MKADGPKNVVLNSYGPVIFENWPVSELRLVNLFTIGEDFDAVKRHLEDQKKCGYKNTDYSAFESDDYEIRLKEGDKWRVTLIKIADSQHPKGLYPEYAVGWQILEELGYQVRYSETIVWENEHPFDGVNRFHFRVRVSRPHGYTRKAIEDAIKEKVPFEKGIGEISEAKYFDTPQSSEIPDYRWTRVELGFPDVSCLYLPPQAMRP